MFSTPNKLVTSKFQNAQKQPTTPRTLSFKNPSPAIPLAPVKPTQLSSSLRSLFGRVGKANQVAKDAPAPSVPPPPPASQAAKATPEKPQPEVQKPKLHHKKSIAQEKPPIWGRPSQVAMKPKSKTNVSQLPRKALPARNTGKTTGSSGKSRAEVLVDNARQLMLPPFRSNAYAVTSRIYRPSRSGIFDYDLSQVEKSGFGHCRVNPMKSVTAPELLLLHSGQRSTYLESRYEKSPDDKYNYPEATSWRYGWFHRQSDPLQKRVPRRDA